VHLLVGLAILIVLAIPLAMAIARSNELVVIDVERGKTRVRRGRIPQRLLSEIADVLRRPKPARAVVRIVAERGQPRVLVTGGLRAAQLQQLRNVVGRFQLAEIRNAPKR
jgi:hypothetical protein